MDCCKRGLKQTLAVQIAYRILRARRGLRVKPFPAGVILAGDSLRLSVSCGSLRENETTMLPVLLAVRAELT